MSTRAGPLHRQRSDSSPRSLTSSPSISRSSSRERIDGQLQGGGLSRNSSSASLSNYSRPLMGIPSPSPPVDPQYRNGPPSYFQSRRSRPLSVSSHASNSSNLSQSTMNAKYDNSKNYVTDVKGVDTRGDSVLIPGPGEKTTIPDGWKGRSGD